MTLSAFKAQVEALDGKGYTAYKSLRGEYDFAQFTLHIDYVQGDPFATPSQVRIQVPQSVAQFPPALYNQGSRRIALADYLTRQFYQETRSRSPQRGTGKSGQIAIAAPSQAMLPRTAVTVSAAGAEIRFTVGLPAFGRRIAGRWAATLLGDEVPRLIAATLHYDRLDAAAIETHCQCAETADTLRGQLRDRQLVAFVANGAVLPRCSGVDERPLSQAAVPFVSPPEHQVALALPNGDTVTGMGIPQGITLIVGGGYHGKSTLLRAIERGVYNHIPGDGRERVVTDPGAVKVRAEDGRSVAGVNISPFINQLPQGKSTQCFSTTDASGSTSQATAIIEAVEAGASSLLIDEDTSATNFMIRDRRMQALIAKEREPITPFIDKVRLLRQDYGISTILVMGGSGDYFDIADTVIGMESYRAVDLTAAAQHIAATYPTYRLAEGGTQFGTLSARAVVPASVDPRHGKRDVSVKVRARDKIQFGNQEIDLAAVEQIVEPGQTKAIAAAMTYARRYYFDGQRSLPEVLDQVMVDIEQAGLDCLSDRYSGEFAAFRPLELAAAINRLRSLKVTGG